MDPLSPTKEEDVAIISKMCSDIHQVFINHVKTSRGSRLVGSDEEIFNGAVWTAEAALKLGLIDGIDNVESYIHRNFGEQVKIKRMRSKFEEIFESFGAHSLFSKPSLSELIDGDSHKIRT